MIPVINKRWEFAKVKHRHYKTNRFAEKHHMWKGGRYKTTLGYWMIYKPEYYKANSRRYIHEHIYLYEQYHKLCMLPWGHIHHIDGNSLDNRIENLQGMMNKKHFSITNIGKQYLLGRHKDTSDRRCYNCKSDKTWMSKHTPSRTPSPFWHHLPWDKENWYCNKCCCFLKRANKKLLSSPSKTTS